ncbi:transposase [Levilactobacillus suantsaii]|uniref:Transposase IS204/IS1001/IS1096/IS1165 DDE domain-containing protein n=1 Tax=Levilactobacillus suantsaii TaxID=2292255 RepID=A0A4Q0VJ65_9LACO|nr:transposase [Levilactobacillus suantsaii]RXI79067.1 hypothetical protein DXH47_04625 [Levilactobacillus suantsaii]
MANSLFSFVNNQHQPPPPVNNLAKHKQLTKTKIMQHNSSFSNGPIKGINRKIKQIKRTAYGYRNW